MKTVDSLINEDALFYQCFCVVRMVPDSVDSLHLLSVVDEMGQSLSTMLNAAIAANELVHLTSSGVLIRKKNPTIISLRYSTPTHKYTGLSHHTLEQHLYVYFKP